MPSSEPSSMPSSMPSSEPSSISSSMPSSMPSSEPSSMPSSMLSSEPSSLPSSMPSRMPSSIPSSLPSSMPSSMPSSEPSSMPSSMPSSEPSSFPSLLPSSKPSLVPSNMPSGSPSLLPSSQPSDVPSNSPTPFSATHFIHISIEKSACDLSVPTRADLIEFFKQQFEVLVECEYVLESSEYFDFCDIPDDLRNFYLRFENTAKKQTNVPANCSNSRRLQEDIASFYDTLSGLVSENSEAITADILEISDELADVQ